MALFSSRIWKRWKKTSALSLGQEFDPAPNSELTLVKECSTQ